jgi:serine protease
MPRAWDINPGGSSTVTVGVVDTGVTSEPATLTRPLWVGQRFETVDLPFGISPDLSASRIVSPRDFAFEPGTRVLDFEGHGTHVASTIAEDGNNARSLAGIAYNARLMPVKVCVGFWELMLERAAFGVSGYIPPDSGGCATEDIAAGIRYAVDNGAKVINLSLGGEEPAPIERDAILYAVANGAIVVCSAGNNFEHGNRPDYPASYGPSIEGLLSVGAVGKSRTRAYYSGTGAHVEIAAPGGSSRDGGDEDEGFVWQVTLRPSDQDILDTPRPRFDRYSEVGYSGTSMAAAHVSAVAALLVSQGVTNPKAIEAILKTTALDLGTPGRDVSFGYGLVQPRTALFGMGIRR